jgi:hypothetical protein
MIISQVLTDKAVTLLQALARGEEPPVLTAKPAALEEDAAPAEADSPAADEE